MNRLFLSIAIYGLILVLGCSFVLDKRHRRSTKRWVATKRSSSPQDRIVTLGKTGRTDEALELYRSVEHPTVRILNGALDACARDRPARLDQAFSIFREATDETSDHRLVPNVFTFGTLMNACSNAQRADLAIKLLRTMQVDYGVVPNGVVYSTAIAACGRTNPPLYYRTALELLDEAVYEKRLDVSVVCYNAALSACAKAGRWEPAISLLDRMVAESRPVDAISYATVLDACERGEQWERVLDYADRMQQEGLELDGIAITSCLHACQRLGNAHKAMNYLQKMKQLGTTRQRRHTCGWEYKGARQPLRGPDRVAYGLVISACARGGEWVQGIELLQEVRDVTGRGDVMTYTAAITGCEYAGEWKEAFRLLETMQTQDGVQPNEVTYAAVIRACGNACANRDDAPKDKALALLRTMREDASIVNPTMAVYDAAIRVCAEAFDLDGAMQLYRQAMEDGLQPTLVTFGSLMTACERVGSLAGVSRVFNMMREAGMKPNEVIFGAAISCLRKEGQPEEALLLLRKMLLDGLEPNISAFNTVLRAQTQNTDLNHALLVFKLIRSSSFVQPNHQTYSVLIQAFASQRQPEGAQALLRRMIQDGFRPEVDLYTSTVTAYEKTRQPLKALKLMESMERDGYDFYAVKVLNTAFKNAVKLVNKLGQTLTDKDDSNWCDKLDDEEQTKQFMDNA